MLILKEACNDTRAYPESVLIKRVCYEGVLRERVNRVGWCVTRVLEYYET